MALYQKMRRQSMPCSSALILTLVFTTTSAVDVELMEFEDELTDPDYTCHWSVWTEAACRNVPGSDACRADLRRRCVCLKFAGIPQNVNSSSYVTRTCSFGTLQEKQDKPDGRCDSNCQLLDSFFRRVEGVHGAWCSWSDWQRSTCHIGSEGLLEGYQTSQRQCLCPPSWLEGDICHGSDSRARNCRESLSHVPSRFLNVWLCIFDSVVIGVVLPLALIAWFCCFAGPMRQGLQLGRLQSAAVATELKVHRSRHRAALKRSKPRGGESGSDISPDSDATNTTGDTDFINANKRRIIHGREATKLRHVRKFIRKI